MRSWHRMDRDIQKRLDAAEASGDPERIRAEQKFAQEAYGTGTGIVVGGTIGTLILPGIGTIIGLAIGGVLGNKIAKD